MTLGIVPNVVERHPNYVDIYFKNDPNVSRYRIGGQRTLDGAWTGTTAMFELERNRTFRSRAVRQRRLGILSDSIRGTCRAIFDPMDYYDGGGGVAPTLPNDQETLYMRVEEFRVALGAYAAAGPVLIVPAPGFYSMPNAQLTVAGTAPASAGGVNPGDPVSANAMHFVLPRLGLEINMTNLDAANDLYYSLGQDRPLSVLPAASGEYITGSFKEMLVEGGGGNVQFSFNIKIATGGVAGT